MPGNELPDLPRRAAVIGCGMIGAGWTARFLAAGLAVRCYDPAPEAMGKALAAIGHGLAVLRVPKERIDALVQSVDFATSLAAAVEDADWIQENGPENEAIKRDLLAQVEAAAPDHAIIASSTSSLPHAKLAAHLARPQNLIIGHPFLPVTLVRGVEVAGDPELNKEALSLAERFYRAIGSVPIICRPVPGLVINRLQAALMREAMHLLAEGAASAADIDNAVVEVLGPRWSATGPFVSHALAGGTGDAARTFEILGSALENLWAALGEPELDDQLRATVVSGCEDAMWGEGMEFWTRKRELVAHSIRDALQTSEESSS